MLLELNEFFNEYWKLFSDVYSPDKEKGNHKNR